MWHVVDELEGLFVKVILSKAVSVIPAALKMSNTSRNIWYDLSVYLTKVKLPVCVCVCVWNRCDHEADGWGRRHCGSSALQHQHCHCLCGCHQLPSQDHERWGWCYKNAQYMFIQHLYETSTAAFRSCVFNLHDCASLVLLPPIMNCSL